MLASPDLKAFLAAFASQNVAAWTDFYADDAEWIEYRHFNPPASPHVMKGKAAIAAHISRIEASDITIDISDVIADGDRAAFCLWVGLASGKRIIEHVIVHMAGGKVHRQVDVEAWDQ